MADSRNLDSMDDIRKAIENLDDRIKSIADQVMMDRLEELAIEEEIDAISSLVDESAQDLQRKIEMLEEIEDRYDTLRIDDKLNYLYTRVKTLEQEDDSDIEERFTSIEDEIKNLESGLNKVASRKKGRSLDDAYSKLFTLRDKVKELQSRSQEHAKLKKKVKQLSAAQSDMEARLDNLSKKVNRAKNVDPKALKREILDSVDHDLEHLKAEIEDLSPADAGDVEELNESIAQIEKDMVQRRQELSARMEEAEENLGRIESSISKLQDGLVEGDLAERLEVTDEHIRERLDELETEIGKLQAREPDSEAVESAVADATTNLDDRIDSLTQQISSLRKDVESHQSRMDAIMQNQNMFEGEIGELIEQQKELNRELQREDQKMQKKLDFLLEALEEGLEEEEEELRALLSRQSRDRDRRDREELRKLVNESIGDFLDVDAEDEDDLLRMLARLTLENQQRMEEMQRQIEKRIDWLHRNAPTIVE